MAFRMGISEIVNKAIQIKDKHERAFYLREHRTEQLELILQYALDPRVKWLIPPGEYPFKRGPSNDLHSILYSEAKKLYLYVEGGHPTLNTKKRFLLFLEFLERLNADDAELMIKVKDQNLPKEINTEVVNLAFLPWWPDGLIPVSETKKVPLNNGAAKPKPKKKPGAKPGKTKKANTKPTALSQNVATQETVLTESVVEKQILTEENKVVEEPNGQDAQIS